MHTSMHHSNKCMYPQYVFTLIYVCIHRMYMHISGNMYMYVNIYIAAPCRFSVTVCMHTQHIRAYIGAMNMCDYVYTSLHNTDSQCIHHCTIQIHSQLYIYICVYIYITEPWLVILSKFVGVFARVPYCDTLRQSATLCNTLQHSATLCNTLQHSPTLSNTMEHSATLCNVLQHISTYRIVEVRLRPLGNPSNSTLYKTL